MSMNQQVAHGHQKNRATNSDDSGADEPQQEPFPTTTTGDEDGPFDEVFREAMREAIPAAVSAFCWELECAKEEFVQSLSDQDGGVERDRVSEQLSYAAFEVAVDVEDNISSLVAAIEDLGPAVWFDIENVFHECTGEHHR